MLEGAIRADYCVSIDLLTHVQLANKTGHVVVLVVEGQQFPGELCLVLDDEAPSILEGQG